MGSYDESKFQEFNKMLKSDADIVVVAYPEVLGDNYEELVENLKRLGDSGKPLHIVPRIKGSRKEILGCHTL